MQFLSDINYSRNFFASPVTLLTFVVLARAIRSWGESTFQWNISKAILVIGRRAIHLRERHRSDRGFKEKNEELESLHEERKKKKAKQRANRKRGDELHIETKSQAPWNFNWHLDLESSSLFFIDKERECRFAFCRAKKEGGRENGRRTDNEGALRLLVT